MKESKSIVVAWEPRERCQKVDTGVMDVCYDDDGSVGLHVLKLTKLYILNMFSSLHTNRIAQLSFNRN